MQAATADREFFGRSTSAWRHSFFGINPRRTLARVMVWWTLSMVMFHHCLLPVKIVGSSMAPTYANGSLNMVNRLSYSAALPKRGDVVALQSADEVLLKRIVALPGETVRIHLGIIYINHLPIADAFANRRVPWEVAETKLSANEYFVIGDNRELSVFGAVQREQIIGKLIF